MGAVFWFRKLYIMKQNFKISILLLFCFLSKVYAEDNYDYMVPCPPCPKNVTCNFVETNDNDCKCKEGYEGENCEIWICDEENKALIYKCNGESEEPCIRLNQICDGNEDCQDGEDENTVCQADNNTCIGPVKLCDGVRDCSDNEDEYDCCYPPSEDPEDPCPEEGKVFDTCAQNCVPKCDGKNDTCVTYHGVYALANSEWSYCAKYSNADEQNCPTSCPNEGEIQCFNADNNPLPLKCEPADKRCDGIEDCKFGEDEKNCPLPPGIICLIVICVIIFLCFVGCIAYYVFKRKNGIYILVKNESKLQTIPENSTPIIKPKLQTESYHSSPTPSLRIESTTSTPPPDFELPPLAYLNPIDVNENGDHHPHFSNHIQSTKTTNAGIIEQLFIDKKPSK